MSEHELPKLECKACHTWNPNGVYVGNQKGKLVFVSCFHCGTHQPNTRKGKVK